MAGFWCDVGCRWVRRPSQCASESASGQLQTLRPTLLCEEVQEQRLFASQLGATHHVTFGQSLEFTGHPRFCARRVGTKLVRTEDLARVPEENSIKDIPLCVLMNVMFLFHCPDPVPLPLWHCSAECNGGENGSSPSLTQSCARHNQKVRRYTITTIEPRRQDQPYEKHRTIY